jgi:hypothetical protein
MPAYRMALAIAACSALTLGSPADAKGCIRGAVAGAVVGHMAHHHAIAGAAAGCVAGHMYYKHKARQVRPTLRHQH